MRGRAREQPEERRRRVPLGTFIAVTGVSGSGKSTLVNEILYRALDAAVPGPPTSPVAHAGIEGIDLVDKVIQIDSRRSAGRRGRIRPRP